MHRILEAEEVGHSGPLWNRLATEENRPVLEPWLAIHPVLGTSEADDGLGIRTLNAVQ